MLLGFHVVPPSVVLYTAPPTPQENPTLLSTKSIPIKVDEPADVGVTDVTTLDDENTFPLAPQNHTLSPYEVTAL